MNLAEKLVAGTRQYLYIPVKSRVKGRQVDTSTDPVWVAIVPANTIPGVPDWRDASWFGTGAPLVRCLVGDTADGATGPLVPGAFDVFVRFIDDVEEPILPSGRITVE